MVGGGGVPWWGVVLQLLLWVGEPCSSALALVHSKAAMRFLTDYITTLDISRVNVFVPAKEDAEMMSLPVEMMRRLSSETPRSVAVHHVNTSSQVLKAPTNTVTTSRLLSVMFLHTSHHLRIFYDVCEAGMVVQHPWLVMVLGNLSFVSTQRPLKPRLPLDNLVTFATLSTSDSSSSSGEVGVYEVYSVTPDTTYVVKKLTTWRGETRQITFPREDWNERRTNLTGLHLRCTTMAQAPFMHLGQPGRDLSVELTGGYARDVWGMLQEIHGFTYECRIPGDRSFGTLVDGKWMGLVGEVVEGRADVAVTSLDHNAARASVVSFTAGLKEVGYRMVAKRPGLMDQTWTSFTSELMPDAWLGTLTFVVVAPPFLTFCARYSPFETQSITLKDAYILAVGAFAIQGSWLEVRSVSTRIVFLTIFVATLVVYAHYTSALVSLLTVTSTSNGFNSLQELLEDRTYNFGFQAGTFLEEEFQRAHHTVFRDVWEKLVLSDPHNLVVNPHIGITKVINDRYVFMIEENQFKSLFGRECQVQLLKTSYFSTQTGFALPLNSPLKKIFDSQLIRMRDGGVLSRAWERWQPPPALCTAPRMVAINFHHIITAFLLLLLGVAVAVVLVPCERFHWNVVGRRKVLSRGRSHHVSTSPHQSSLFVQRGTSTRPLTSYPPVASSTSHFHNRF